MCVLRVQHKNARAANVNEAHFTCTRMCKLRVGEAHIHMLTTLQIAFLPIPVHLYLTHAHVHILIKCAWSRMQTSTHQPAAYYETHFIAHACRHT